MQTAWFALHLGMRDAYPHLRIGFAMRAGLARRHHERAAARGAAPQEPHPQTFVETSSYGAGMATALGAVIGEHGVVHGSDFPVATPAYAPTDPPSGAGFGAARFIDGMAIQ